MYSGSGLFTDSPTKYIKLYTTLVQMSYLQTNNETVKMYLHTVKIKSIR